MKNKILPFQFINIINLLVKWEPVKGSIGSKLITCGWVLAMLTAGFLVYAMLNSVGVSYFYDSDGLWVEDYLRDLVTPGVNMSTWMSPGAPNYFPEMLIYGLVRLLTGDLKLAMILFSAIKIILIGTSFYAIAGLATNQSKLHRIWFASLACTVVCLGLPLSMGNTLLEPCGAIGNAFAVAFSCTEIGDMWQFYNPGRHGGAYSNVLFALIFTLLWLRNSSGGRLWLALLFVLSVLSLISDKLFLVWFIAPVLQVVGLLAILRHVSWGHFLKLAALLIAAVFISGPINHLLNPIQVVDTNYHGLESTRKLIEFLSHIIGEYGYYQMVAVSYSVVAVIAAWLVYREWRGRAYATGQVNKTKPTARLFIITFAALIPIANLMSMALTNNLVPRYMGFASLAALSVWLWLPLLGPWNNWLWARGVTHVVILGFLALNMGFLAMTSPAPVIAMTHWDDPYPKIVACLDAHANEYNLKNGLADYWRARQISILSKKNLHADQAIKGELIISPFVANLEKSYSEKLRTFVLTNTPTHTPPLIENEIIRFHGRPDARFLCEGYPVLVYKNGLNVVIPFAERVFLFNKGKVDKLIIKASEMPSDVGQNKEGALFSSGKMGWLLFGPYITLPSGSYRVVWKGHILNKDEEQIGEASISTDMGGNILARTTISRKPLSSLPSGELAEARFTINNEIKLTEFRLFLHENVLVKMDEVVIRRLTTQNLK